MVMQALGELQDAKAVDELMPLLRDASADVRLAAAAALAKIAEPRAVGPLTEALEAAKGHERVLMADPCFALARKLLDSDERGEGRARDPQGLAETGDREVIDRVPNLNANSTQRGSARAKDLHVRPMVLQRLDHRRGEAIARSFASNDHHRC